MDAHLYIDLYKDYENALKYLRGIKEEDYDYPEDVVNFHLYSEIQTEKELLAVKSFFATQDLMNTRLILWSDYDIRDNARLAVWKDQIDFRVFDPVSLAEDTPLQGMDSQLLADDSLHYMKSGLLRFLALYKYGGIWYDMDMVLLRNLVPLFKEEFAYMWGSEMDFAGFGPCAAFMNIHKKSEHATLCLEELAKAPIRPDTVCRDHEMLASVYKRRPFTVYPSAYFNTEWQINSKFAGLGTSIESGWFNKNTYSQYLFLEAFSWHWHNSTHRFDVICPGSKFDLLEKLIDHKLLTLSQAESKTAAAMLY